MLLYLLTEPKAELPVDFVVHTIQGKSLPPLGYPHTLFPPYKPEGMGLNDLKVLLHSSGVFLKMGADGSHMWEGSWVVLSGWGGSLILLLVSAL